MELGQRGGGRLHAHGRDPGRPWNALVDVGGYVGVWQCILECNGSPMPWLEQNAGCVPPKVRLLMWGEGIGAAAS